MPLPPDEIRRIEQITAQRAHEACRLLAPTKYYREMRPTPNEGIQPSVKEFADKVVLQEHSRDWGTSGFYSENLAKKLPLFYLLQTRDIKSSNNLASGYPSWIYFHSHPIGIEKKLERFV